LFLVEAGKKLGMGGAENLFIINFIYHDMSCNTTQQLVKNKPTH